MTKTTALLGLALGTLLLVAYVHGGVTGATVWNAAPLPFALLPLLVVKTLGEVKYAIYLFGYTIVTVILLVHLCYLADAGGVLSIAALSGKKIFGLPAYAVASGYLVGFVGVAVREVRSALREKP